MVVQYSPCTYAQVRVEQPTTYGCEEPRDEYVDKYAIHQIILENIQEQCVNQTFFKGIVWSNKPSNYI